MHHITEDTPPDMLAGAMDLSVRLPDGREVNMAVERSTPMMDLLVQVTTAYKLRPSDHIIQAMDMNVERGKERVLPYKPNAPIGALDTQRVRVLPKNRAPAPKAPAPSGHQPFESTFRLQVHLPRNQFCVIRVGKHVLLEDIMRRVCEEKNLDPRKYEFRHPANIDKVLDPKRTLNDYEITEITVVHRGSSMSRAISSSDIMVLQREDERRKLQAKTGGGVLNLIFRRGRTSMGSGSISSDTRSISPTQSDDSRSVTPPAVQPPKILPAVPQESKTSPNRPKPPQRKRRPAPKPPTPLHQSGVDSAHQPTPLIREVATQLEEEQCQTEDVTQESNGLTICHSRNSSDSSGYHEASILSDNCNTTTLPRRPKSTLLNNNNHNNNSSLASSTYSVDKTMDFSKSTGNLTNMSSQSKSTLSLTNAGRKKKAPPPPPVLQSSGSVSNLNTVNNNSTPVVASSPHPRSDPKPTLADLTSPAFNNDSIPQPKPRTVKIQAPVPRPRSVIKSDDNNNEYQANTLSEHPETESLSDSKFDTVGRKRGFSIGKSMLAMDSTQADSETSILKPNSPVLKQASQEENFNLNIDNIEMFESKRSGGKSPKSRKFSKQHHGAEIHDLEQSKSYGEVLKRTSTSSVELSGREDSGVPGFIASSLKKWSANQEWVVGDSDADSHCPTPSDLTSLPRSSITSLQTDLSLQSVPEVQPPKNSPITVTSRLAEEKISDHHRNTAIVKPTTPDIIKPKSSSVEDNKSTLLIVNQTETKIPLVLESQENIQIESMQESDSKVDINNRRKSKENGQELSKSDADNHKLISKETDFKSKVSKSDIDNLKLISKESLLQSKESKTNESIEEEINSKRTSIESIKEPEFKPKENGIKSPIQIKEESVPKTLDNQVFKQKSTSVEISKAEEEETNDLEWQYTLPSPPTAFRDASPTNFTDMTNYDTLTFNEITTTDSVVTSPALFDKLGSVKNSETETIVSENESNTSKQSELLASKYLSVETLEKRSSLVLERELTSLTRNDTDLNTVQTQRHNVINEIEEVFQGNKKNTNLSRSNSQSREKMLSAIDTDSTLPNFKMSTYEQPKKKINIFEDDSIRSNVESANASKRNSIAEFENSSKRNSLLSGSENVFAMNTSESKRNSVAEFDNSSKRNSLISGSSENVFAMKSSDNFIFKKPHEFPRYKQHSSVTNITNDNKPNDVSRSESFTHKNGWSRLNPVKRSKSHISLERWKDDEKKNGEETEDGLHKSNSLFNVSGLSSLEVMRLILPKLGNTPPATPTEEQKPDPIPPQAKVESIIPIPESPEVKKYQYRGPPAINLSTWSERPKSNVSLKEDRDYKISNLKSKFNSPPEPKKIENSNSPQSISSVNIRVEPRDQVDSGKINIKINSEPISHQSNGNVIIKIGENNISENTEKVVRRDNGFYSRFLNQTQATGYRKPLGNINGVGDKPRPHSIAFDASCPDLSRVPIVRAVELKKPFKDGNKSVTQIIHDLPSDRTRNEDFLRCNTQNGDSSPKSNTLGAQNRHSSVYLSSESLAKVEENKPLAVFPKPVARGNSFASRMNMPTVKGFRMPAESDKMPTWGNNRYGTLPSIATPSKTLEAQTTFSQNHFKRVEPSKITENEAPFPQHHLKRVEPSKPTVNGTSFSQNSLKRVDQPKENETPFSFSHLKRVEPLLQKPQQENSIFQKVKLRSTPKVSSFSAPPPPQMPKIVTAVTKRPMQRQRHIEVDPRDQLLDSIRSFGGKAGLRAAK